MSSIRLILTTLLVVNCLKLNGGQELTLRQSFKSRGVQEVISLTVEFLRDSELSNNVFISDQEDYTHFSVQQDFVSVVILGRNEVPKRNSSATSAKLGSKHHLHLNAPLRGASLRTWKETYSTTLGLRSKDQVVEARWKQDFFIILRDGSLNQKCKWAETEDGLRLNLYALAILERQYEEAAVITMTEYAFRGPFKTRRTSSALSSYFQQPRRTATGTLVELRTCKVQKRVLKQRRRPKRSSGTPHRHRHSRSGKRALASTLLTVLQKRAAQIEQNVPRPIRLLTWVTVILLCIIAGALFALVKVTALTGIDQTWHDCVLQHLVEIVRKEDKLSKDYKDPEVGGDEDCQEEPIVDRCKASQSVVRGTVRVVSFILVAFYEGNLYNSITISKTGAVSNAVNQLMAASRNPALLEPSSRYLLNGSVIVIDGGAAAMQSGGRKQQLDLPTAIQDCLSWSNTSLSGACAGYEFDPRNLPLGNFKYQQHKFQKQELWNRILHSGGRGSGSIKKTSFHSITSLLQPLAQFCQWVIETGTFHAWNSFEQMVLYRGNNNNYSEAAQRRIVADDDSYYDDSEESWRINLVNYSSNGSLLSMRDYLGLLFIYLFLNLTALVIFGSEITFSYVQARLSRHVVVKGIKVCCGWFAAVGAKFKGMYRGGIRFGSRWFKRKCACVKVKHFVNNFV